jgi:hypothetical protein
MPFGELAAEQIGIPQRHKEHKVDKPSYELRVDYFTHCSQFIARGFSV